MTSGSDLDFDLLPLEVGVMGVMGEIGAMGVMGAIGAIGAIGAMGVMGIMGVEIVGSAAALPSFFHSKYSFSVIFFPDEEGGVGAGAAGLTGMRGAGATDGFAILNPFAAHGVPPVCSLSCNIAYNP